MRKLVVDLFCGLGGWTRGFLAEAYDAVGFDIERHQYGDKRYPAQLVLQDVLTLDGRQFREASAIVASPPCQRYSWMAMPWGLAKREVRWQEWERDSPFGDRLAGLRALFDACFRIQREASEAAGHHIPLVVENVRGAQPWVGRAKANYGSYFLWGDVESIGGRIVAAGAVTFGAASVRAAGKFNPDGTSHGQGSWFAVADSKNRGAQKREGRNFHAFENGLGSSPTFNGGEHETRHVKGGNGSWFNITHGERIPGDNAGNPARGMNEYATATAVKGKGGTWFVHPNNANPRERGHWKERACITRHFSSGSSARKAASAMIAEIPFELASHVARCYA